MWVYLSFYKASLAWEVRLPGLMTENMTDRVSDRPDQGSYTYNMMRRLVKKGSI